MATGGDNAPCSPESLICPLCLDVFEDATLLSCGHTFCRKCLKRYDASHLDRDHMVCPLCRSDTKLQDNRVEELPANGTVNGLVDDYHSNTGGLYASLELKVVRCTVCVMKEDAVSFCKECNAYMCDNCQSGHQQMHLFFADHQVVSMSEVSSGKVIITQPPERCPIHKQENRDLFCEECRVYICFKCVIVAHRDHNIKNHHDFERELQVKVESLLERCKDKKTELEKNIQSTEARRQEVHAAVQKLEIEVRDAYEKKARQLKDNERLLLENLQSLKKGFNDDLDVLKAKDRQRIKSIVSSVSLVANDRLGCLEGDSFTAHCMLCDELEQTLKEVKDDTSAGVISKTARDKLFKRADGSFLDLGEIGMCSTMRVSGRVDLRGSTWGMAALSEDNVIICYTNAGGADKVDTKGNTSQHFQLNAGYHDLAHQSHTGNTVVVGDDRTTLLIYSHSGSRHMHTRTVNISPHQNRNISSNHVDEIIIANCKNSIMIYDPSINTQLCSITTKYPPCQAFETRSGAIIASTYCQTNPCKVTAYDRSGVVGDTLTADPGEYMYAAVDSQDRVYVASVNQGAGKVAITEYKMEGLKFEKVFQFDELKLALGHAWCYMLSLSHDMLAFASGTKLYFIEV